MHLKRKQGIEVEGEEQSVEVYIFCASFEESTKMDKRSGTMSILISAAAQDSCDHPWRLL
jgi:hypothetical protein